MNNLRLLPDHELLECVKSLAARERGATAELIAHLAELETRGLHLAAGYGSMFTYCRDVLLLSEHEAYNRIEAARAARRFPVILDLLAQGAVNLTTVRLLAPHLTDTNHIEVLESARGLRKPQVEEIVARLAPAPDVPAVVRKLPTRTAPAAAVVPGLLPATAVTAVESEPAAATASAPATASANAVRAIVSALAPERYKLQLTISGDTLEKLRLAKDMLRHAVPSGDDAELLDRALTALLAELAKKKFAASDKPQPARGVAPGSRHIPAEVKRAVFLRDFGRCAFIGTAGRRCGERAFIEFHHLRPYVHGGPATIDNLELRCGRHNRHEWQREAAYRRGHEAQGPPLA